MKLQRLYHVARLWFRFQCCHWGWHTLRLVGYIQSPIYNWGRVEFCAYCSHNRVSPCSRQEAETAIDREPQHDLTGVVDHR